MNSSRRERSGSLSLELESRASIPRCLVPRPSRPDARAPGLDDARNSLSLSELDVLRKRSSCSALELSEPLGVRVDGSVLTEASLLRAEQGMCVHRVSPYPLPRRLVATRPRFAPSGGGRRAVAAEPVSGAVRPAAPGHALLAATHVQHLLAVGSGRRQVELGGPGRPRWSTSSSAWRGRTACSGCGESGRWPGPPPSRCACTSLASPSPTAAGGLSGSCACVRRWLAGFFRRRPIHYATAWGQRCSASSARAGSRAPLVLVPFRGHEHRHGARAAASEGAGVPLLPRVVHALLSPTAL